MQEIEASYSNIGVGDIVFFHRVCRAVDCVWMAKGQGEVLHHWHQRPPHAGFNMSVLQQKAAGAKCALDNADPPGVVVVAGHFVVAEMLLHPEPSPLQRVI
jgi:hypothetical protein